MAATLMRAAEMDRLLQFQRFTTSDDGFTSVEAWADHGDPIKAKRIDISDGERWRANQVEAIVTARFTVRSNNFTRDLSAKDRFTSEGDTYNISGIKEIGRRRFLEITAARVDA